MIRRGHVPQRMCAGCGRRREQAVLVRLTVRVRDGVNVLQLDTTGRRPGRGTWLCASESCLDRALKQDKLKRRLNVNAVAPGLREDFIDYLMGSDKDGKKKSIRNS